MAREMKDSGVEWIGEIPVSWSVKKIKNVVEQIGSGTTPASDNKAYFGGNIYWIQSGDIYGKDSIEDTAVKVTEEAIRDNPVLQIYRKEFIIIAMYGGSVGNIAISHIDACTNQACCCIKTNADNLLQFMFYWISACKNDFLRLSMGGGQPNISQGKIKNESYVQPQLKDQHSIVHFLNNKCEKVDNILSKTRASIEEYKKLKQAIITQAVTKGVRGKRGLKDSGSVWFGQIPSDWDMRKVKYIFKIQKDIVGEEGHTVLSITQKGIKPKDLSKNEGQLAENYSNYQLVHIGDFAMNHMDLLTGWVDISKYEGVTSPDYRVFQIINKDSCHGKYYLYLMQMCYTNRIFYGLGQGVSGLGRWRLQADKFLNFTITMPDYEEQKEIADYLDNKISEIDKIIQKKEQYLAEIENYKKSLIYEYVTGKKEVPEKY